MSIEANEIESPQRVRRSPGAACYADFSIEHYEPNPHQVKESMLKNRTYQRFSWREKYRLKNMTEEEAVEEFASFGKNWRLIAIGGDVVIQNVTA